MVQQMQQKILILFRFFSLRPLKRWQLYASFFEQSTKATLKTDGKISFFRSLVMEMDAQ